ncbi:ABC transporter permease [Aquibacillus rhizosphaerae]|uniref:ABC transporter permease n=1 Tax=Aquibacillus rhizosphaerae TaxID=3051431 RepID=A0ABT7L2T8_9BACI|nr:ABC transporter permease [Aquibacillus sp. LR5S19]MDL4839495.1 ABC transporter permease [Aquibacillus sp. LR5S19]
MIYRIYQSTIFTSKLALRTWLFPIFFICLNSYIIYTFYIYRFQTFSPPSALTTSSYFVIFGMLAYLLFGMWIIRVEKSTSMSDLTLLIDNGYLFGFLSKVLVGIITILTSQIILMASYIAIFYGHPITDVPYYLAVFKYITVFWSISFFISFLLGMLLASVIKGKSVYPVLLLVFCFLIPINHVFLESANRVLNFDLDSWLNLGEPNPYSVYHAFYGFSIDYFHWMKKLLFLSIIFLLFIFLFIKKKIIHLGKPTYIVLLLFVIVFSFSAIEITKKNQILVNDPTRIIDYYRNNEQALLMDDQAIRLDDFDIFLKPNAHLEADVTFTITNEGREELNSLHFALFHELKISELHSNGIALNYVQDGDFVTVELNNAIESGEKIDISMHYEGLKTNLYFGNNQAIYLPHYFPWLPSTNLKPAFDLVTDQKGLHRIKPSYQEETNYRLTINYDKKVYTNLNKQAEGTWSGKSSSGLSVISGMLNENSQENYQWIYPVTWEQSVEDFSTFETYFRMFYNTITNSLDLNIEKPNRVFFIPNLNISDTLNGESVWVNGSDLILGTPIYIEPDQDYFDIFQAELTYELVPALTTNKLNTDMDDYEFQALFNIVFAKVINKQMNINDDTDTLKFFISEKLTVDQDVNTVVKELKDFLSKKEAEDANHPLYQEWLHLIESKKSWDELYALIKQFNNREVSPNGKDPA